MSFYTINVDLVEGGQRLRGLQPGDSGGPETPG
jgi:hypothetical protein